MNYTAGQLATMIKIACKKDVIDLGEDDQQDGYIFEWINLFLYENAKKIRKVVISDELVINATGYVTFKVNSQPIVNMYEPHKFYDPTDKGYSARTSFDGPAIGWFREDAFSEIHVRGLVNTFRLQYIKYPDKITLATQIPECPPAGYGELISYVCGKIKLTKGYYQESEFMMNQANSKKLAIVKASMNGMGTNSQKPGPDDANLGG